MSDCSHGGGPSTKSPWNPSECAPVGVALGTGASRASVGLLARSCTAITVAAAAAAAAPTVARAPVSPPRAAAPGAATVVAAAARGAGRTSPLAAMAMKPPLLVVPLLRLATALERLVDAAGVTTNVALDLVPIGVDAGGTANGDGVVLLGLPLLLPLFGKLSLGLSICQILSLPRFLKLLGLGSLGQ